MAARYLIGIDLGTTNSAVAFVDTAAADPRVRVFEVAQLIAPGEVAARRQLPSFVYLAGEHDLAPHETALPWNPAARPRVTEAIRAVPTARPRVTEAIRAVPTARPRVTEAIRAVPTARPRVTEAIRAVPTARPRVTEAIRAVPTARPRVTEAIRAVPTARPRVTEAIRAVPTARIVVGELARAQGARMASRMIASAKSWLCHPGVDRSAAILPWGGIDVPKLSPIQAQAEILGHIRGAWDAAHPDALFAAQEVLITVPASFDEAARELTLQAAAKAGFPPVVLLEEPQAAFYAWIDAKQGKLAPGERVLVFDVGGGTTDFTLIDVDADGFTRTAVGDHLLLGGDNLDLTLAKIVEQRVGAKTGKKLDTLQWHGLVHACRLAKEALLGDTAPASAPIAVQSRGSKMIGGTARDEITRSELDQILFEGFFPLVARDAQLSRARGGLQEFGLPYAADPAITRHLASFVQRHVAAGARLDAVLFNGGAMTPASLRERVLDQIGRWQGSPPRELPAAMPEMAVAQGAAYYGLVRRGLATRIKGGTPRAFYVGVDLTASPSGDAAGGGQAAAVETGGAERMAVCLAPGGLEDGARVELARDFTLVTNRPVSFRLYSSSSRQDSPGALVPIGDGRPETLDDGSDLLELPPIVTVLRARGRSEVTVRLAVHITELGALEILCVDTGEAHEQWKLAFDMRSGGAAAAPSEGSEPHPKTGEAVALVKAAFATSAALPTLARDLETLLEARRDEWTMQTARALFDALVEVAGDRKKSADHEQRWLNLAGFLLRPGTGAPLDAWRSRVMWGVFNEGLAFAKVEPNKLAWWIAWRRIAGGLVKGQQDQLYDRLAQLVLPSTKQNKKLADVKPSKQELAEIWRTVASLERLPTAHKIRLGDELVQRMATRKGLEDGVHLWALSRVGARVPLYGPLDAVVAPSKVAAWITAVLAADWPEPDKVAFPLAQLGRRTDDRTRDIDDATRSKLAAVVRALPGGDRAVVLVEQVVALEAREERVALGDTLPAGLRLVLDESNAEEPLG